MPDEGDEEEQVKMSSSESPTPTILPPLGFLSPPRWKGTEFLVHVHGLVDALGAERLHLGLAVCPHHAAQVRLWMDGWAGVGCVVQGGASAEEGASEERWV